MMRHDIHPKESRKIILLMVCMSFLMQVSGQSDLPDNMLEANCSTDAQQQPWDAHVLYSANDIHNYYVPLTGDIDGDGMVEIIAGKSTSNDYYTTQVGIYRGSNLQLIAIVMHCYDDKLRSYDINGNLLATSNANTPCKGVVSVADFSYDGWPEDYVGVAIFDAAALTQLCIGSPGSNKGRSWGRLHAHIIFMRLCDFINYVHLPRL